MKKCFVFLAGIFCAFALAGCNNSLEDEEDGFLSLEDYLAVEASAQTEQKDSEGDGLSESMKVAESDTICDESAEPYFVQCGSLKAEYRYEDLYLSLDIPDGWDYEIKTVEDREKEDGLAVCSILFWPEQYPDAVFELSYLSTFLGMCATGVTIEHFTLPNGITGTSYMETIQDTLWMTLSLKNPMENLNGEDLPEPSKSGGVYYIEASVDVSVWDEIEETFEYILESVWVGADAPQQ